MNGSCNARPTQTNQFNAVAIFTDTYAAQNDGLIIIYLLHPTTSKEYFDIHRPSFPIIEVLETGLDANICRQEHRWILIPAACTSHCPLVSCPLPSHSPAVAGCFASGLGCSHRLWTGCPLCSVRTEMTECQVKKKILKTTNNHSKGWHVRRVK